MFCLPDVAKFNKTDATDSSNQGDPDTNTAQQTAETELSTTTDAASEQQLVSRIALNDNKAGMQGLDKDRINQIIYEASKGFCNFDFSVRGFAQILLSVLCSKCQVFSVHEVSTESPLWNA